jgi:hypothetical protein
LEIEYELWKTSVRITMIQMGFGPGSSRIYSPVVTPFAALLTEKYLK